MVSYKDLQTGNCKYSCKIWNYTGHKWTYLIFIIHARYLQYIMTLKELELLNKDIKFTYVGDSNNVTNSLIIGFSKLGIDITIGCPQKYSPPEEITRYVGNQKEGGKLNLVHDPIKAVSGADVVYTDVWLSMGDEKNKQKLTDLKKFSGKL